MPIMHIRSFIKSFMKSVGLAFDEACAQNISFINSVNKKQIFHVSLPYQGTTTVSLETNPFLVCQSVSWRDRQLASHSVRYTARQSYN